MLNFLPYFVTKETSSQEIERSSICVLKVSTSKLMKMNGRDVEVVIVWKLYLQLPMESVPIPTKVVSSLLAKLRCQNVVTT